MSCCKHTLGFGLTDAFPPGGEPCDLGMELAQLSDALEQADALGLYNEPTIIAGHALYSGSSMSIGRADCARVSSGLKIMAAQVQLIVNAHLPPEERPGIWEQLQLWLKGLPSWALPVAGAAAGGLVLFSTAGGMLARRGRRGKRRRR